MILLRMVPHLNPARLKKVACAAGCLAALAACTAQRPHSVAAAGPVPLHAASSSAPAGDSLTVTFPNGSSALDAQAIATLDKAARLYRDVTPVQMYSSGYASRSGTEATNLILSARRALVVKRALVARGIPAGRLLVRAFGATEADGDNDRRVVITWKAS